MLITFSGMDGCGKSTQIDRLDAELSGGGRRPVRLWSRGGYTDGMLLLKRVMRRIGKQKLPKPGESTERTEAFGNPRVARLWLLLSILDLIRVYGLQIRLWETLGRPVLCDRYLRDTLVDFQMKFPEVDVRALPEWRLLERLAARPNLEVFLDLTPDDSETRSVEKNDPWPEPLEARRRRHRLYQALIVEGHFTVIDATLSINSVTRAITGALEKA